MSDTGLPSIGDGLLDQVFVESMRRTGAPIGGLYLLPPDEEVLRLTILRGVPTEFFDHWVRTPLNAPIPATEAVRKDRLIWVNGQEAMARMFPRVALVLPYPFSLVAAPVNGPTRCRGSLFLIWPGVRAPRLSRHDRGRVAVACRRLGDVLEDAARAGHPLEPPERPRVLAGAGAPKPTSAADFTERLPGGCGALDLEGRFTFVSATAAKLLGGDVDGLLGTVPWHSLPWLESPVYEDQYRAAVMSREPTSFTAYRPPDHWLRIDLYPDDNGISVRVYREAGDPGNGRQSPPDRPFGIHTPRRVGQLYRLTHLAAVLTEAVSVSDVVERVSDEILATFDAQGLALFHVEEGHLRLTGYRGYTKPEVEPFDGLPLDSGSGEPSLSTVGGLPTFFSTRDELLRVHPEIRLISAMQAWAVLPLVASNRPIGTCVVAFDRPHPFPVSERAVMSALAGVIAQALDRARLFDAKLQIAHDLQDALLPRTLPTLPGLLFHARYLSATHGMNIGGDFYDLIKIGPTSAAAVIGDVQGHNVAAAALMGQIRTAIHAHTAAGAAPDEVLVRTNQLLSDLDTNLFASCLYVHIDLARHRARFANAGHLPPVLWRPGQPARVLDVAPGLLLGVDTDAEYPITEVALPPESVLVLYTDGLVEKPGIDIGHAIADLARILTDAPLPDLERAAGAVLSASGAPDQQSDDIALFLLRAAPAGRTEHADHAARQTES